jgi:TPR repeat protein
MKNELNRKIALLFVIAYLGFPNIVFSVDYNPYAVNVKILQPRAEAGQSEAQFALGKLYYYGFGIEHNFTEAIKWFRASANHGHASAQFLLGEAHEKGKGLDRDYTQAAKWYKRAAFGGHYLAIYRLSNLYAHGRGVRKNIIKAYAWNKLITSGSWEMAKSPNIELEKIMDQEQLNQAQILSIELKKKIRASLP